MKKQTKNLFGDMTMSEIKAWEKKSNSVVLFDNDTGIAFQKSEDDGDALLAILIDGVDRPVVLVGEQIARLKRFLNINF